MLDLYTWGTPNGVKPLILLEELGAPYELHRVDIRNGAQRESEFLKLSPNGKIPALITDRGTPLELRMFESGAMLIHLAETHDRFLPSSGQARVDTLAWLMFQVGTVGPMFGQLHHFASAERPDAYAAERFKQEVTRAYRVLDRRLAETRFLAGDYSIADIATFKWASSPERMGVNTTSIPHVMRWLEEVGSRPAVKRALAIPFA